VTPVTTQISASRGRSTRRWRKLRAAVLADSTVCVVCGHGGADAVDHLEARAVRPELAESRSNLGAIHGADGCPTCLRKCNSEKAARPLADVVQLDCSRDWFAPC
jgi:5-methylcytosine-specific restriction endonuclease McrA